MFNYSPKCVCTNPAVCSSRYLGMVDFSVCINQPLFPDRLLPSFPKIHKGGQGKLKTLPSCLFLELQCVSMLSLGNSGINTALFQDRVISP